MLSFDRYRYDGFLPYFFSHIAFSEINYNNNTITMTIVTRRTIDRLCRTVLPTPRRRDPHARRTFHTVFI